MRFAMFGAIALEPAFSYLYFLGHLLYSKAPKMTLRLIGNSWASKKLVTHQLIRIDYKAYIFLSTYSHAVLIWCLSRMLSSIDCWISSVV